MAAGSKSIGSLRGYEDRERGIREVFLTPEIDGGRTIAVLSEPITRSYPFGWVICHSFGPEQDNLQTFEAGLARRLAAAGFPVLRYHSQGYGDSELSVEHATPRSHLQGAVDAAALLMTTPRVERIGFIGARFGGSVALLAADRLESAAVVMIDPIIRGRSYMQASILSGLVAGLSGRIDTTSSDRDDPVVAMRRVGYADVLGFPLRAEVFDEISELDLPAAVARFAGRSLVMQVTRSSRPRKDLQLLAERLTALGGVSRLEVVADENALRFGLSRFRTVGASKKEKIDPMADLDDTIAGSTVRWSASVVAGPTGEGEA